MFIIDKFFLNGLKFTNMLLDIKMQLLSAFLFVREQTYIVQNLAFLNVAALCKNFTDKTSNIC